jgi:signal transduction histidine kinase
VETLINPREGRGAIVPTKQSEPEIEPISLRFSDRQVEDDFAQTRFSGSLGMIRGACALGASLMLAFAYLDAVFIPSDKVDMIRLLRFIVLVPCLVGALIATYLVASRRLVAIVLGGAIGLVGLMWSVLLVIAGPDTTTYFYPNVIMTVLFAFFMLDQPFRYAAPLAWGMSLIHIVTMFVAFPALPNEQLLAASVPLLAICAIATYGAYQIHMTSRQLYLQSVALRAEQAAREDADNARLDWLENMARFLRHELRNTMIGISSSLELLSRKGVKPGADVYVHRARRSVTYMRKLVADSAEATSLELSLQQDQPGPVELSGWLTDQVEVYRQSHPGREFRVEIKTRAIVATTEERITQLLDKLVSNAIEHANDDAAIQICLDRDGKDALLVIADRGDRLPEDKDEIFGLFSSTKTGRRGDNIGLGLHIAKLIAEAHGGSIRAVDQFNPPGARFEVRLPMGYFNLRNRAGRARVKTERTDTRVGG